MYKLETVNNFAVQPLIENSKHVSRNSLFKAKQPLILIASKKNSGKTTLVGNILENIICHYPQQLETIEEIVNQRVTCLNDSFDDTPKYKRRCTFIIFSATINKDPVWNEILDMIASSGCGCLIEPSTFDDQGRDLVTKTLSDLDRVVNFDEPPSDDPLQKSIDDMLKPLANDEYVWIFDDLATELKKNTSIDMLTNNMRHFRIRHLIMSSQNAKDFSLKQWGNADNIIVFKKLQPSRIKHIYENSAVSIPFKNFENVYSQATDGKHNFLMIDVNNEKFYKNFNQRFKL